jgi:hypothetical protein
VLVLIEMESTGRKRPEADTRYQQLATGKQTLKLGDYCPRKTTTEI